MLTGRRVCDLDFGGRNRFDREDKRDLVENAVVLLDEFEAGKPVEEWLFKDSQGELQPPEPWLVDLVRGLPSDRAYAPAGVRWYQKTPDDTGYRCELAASRVAMDDPGLGRCWHRCDVWYCDEMPFGVLRWKTTVSREDTGEVVQVMTWVAEELR